MKQNQKFYDFRLSLTGYEDTSYLIYSMLNMPNKNRLQEKKLTGVKTLFANLILTYLANKSLIISRDRNTYTIPAVYGFDHYTYRIIVPIIDALLKEQLIAEKRGHYDYSLKKGTRTSIKATPKLMEFARTNLNYTRIEYPVPIVLKDDNKKVINYQVNLVSEKIVFLQEYNEFLQSNIIQIPIQALHPNTLEGCAYDSNDFSCSNQLSIYDIISTESNFLSNSPIVERFPQNIH